MKPVNRWLLLVIFFIVASGALTLSVYKPYHNWDMVMYIAATKSYEESNVKSLQTFAYDALRHSVSEEKYENLTQAGYGHTIRTDPSAFKEQLPFYQIRPLYTGAMFLLYKTGVDIGFASHIISGVAVVVALAFLYLMSVSFLGAPFAYAVPFLVLIFRVINLARISTPDGMAFLAIVLSAYLYLKRRAVLLLFLLPIILCIRTDLILFTIPLLFYLFVIERPLRKKIALSIAFSVILYIAIGIYWGNEGWTTIFYCTVIQRLSHPISMPPTLTVHNYFHALFNGITTLPNNSIFLLYCLVFIYSLYAIINRIKTKSLFYAINYPPAALSIVCFIFVFSHFILLPVAWHRYFSAPYLIGTFSFLVMMSDHLKRTKD